MSTKADEETSEYINTLSPITFRGPIIQINTPEILDETILTLQNEPCVGFDTESRPSFVKGKTYPISIVQIASPSVVYIVKLRNTGMTDLFTSFLESPIEKVGVGLMDDMRKLSEERSFTPGGLIDLSRIAKSKGYLKTSLRVLCARYLKQRIVKSAQKTNWARTNLTETQLRYAATDAWACLLIRPYLEQDPGSEITV